ncbi:hypothetical protein [Undibacterium sp. TJN19]|uniref:hypothetical protein n=1 Tax=Undibacterium sp. TJN19 TaxID=3413055 RepID=UPI003BF3FD1A
MRRNRLQLRTPQQQLDFAIAYPNYYDFDWNDCGKVGDYQVDGRDIDNVGFINVLIDKLINDLSTEKTRIFAIEYPQAASCYYD